MVKERFKFLPAKTIHIADIKEAKLLFASAIVSDAKKVHTAGGRKYVSVTSGIARSGKQAGLLMLTFATCQSRSSTIHFMERRLNPYLRNWLVIMDGKGLPPGSM